MRDLRLPSFWSTTNRGGGTRRGARLGEAIMLYAALASSGRAPQVLKNLVDALFRDQRFEELKDLFNQVGPGRDPVTYIAVLASADGPPAAISWTTGNLPPDRQREALLSAAGRLIEVRSYGRASRLTGAAARGAPNEEQLTAQAAGLERVQPHTSAPRVTGPAAPAFDLLIETYRGVPIERLFESRSRHARRLLANPDYVREYQRSLEQIHEGLRGSRRSSEVILDIAMATRQASVEGEPGFGYKVNAQVSGRKSTFFVVEEDGQPKLLDMVARPSDNLTDLAHEVLARVDAGRVDRARKLLEWAYEMRQASNASDEDDPLSGPAFARFWDPDAVVGIEEVRWAAATLLAENVYDAEAAVEILRPALESAADPEDRIRFYIALSIAYSRLRWDEELLDVARPLFEAYPQSDVAFGQVALALLQLQRGDEMNAHLADRLEENPTDLTALRMKMLYAVQEADLATARAAGRAIRSVRELGADELNNLAWTALAAEAVDADAIAQIEKAVELMAKNPNHLLLNTLAAIYAEAGRLEEARTTLLNSMRLAGMIRPDSNSWYVFGRIAEQYGEFSAAREMYQRVERPDHDNELRASAYWLSQRRLESLPTAP